LTSSKLKSLDAIISWEDVLIAALVTFDVPGGASLAEMTASFEQSAPKFSGMPGVIAKYYLFDGAMTGGAFYVLSSREYAARMFNDEWRKMLTERYGSPSNSLGVRGAGYGHECELTASNEARRDKRGRS
jgi:hypothetical protein